MKARVGEPGQLLNPETVNKSVFGLQKHDTAEELWLKDVHQHQEGEVTSNQRHWYVDETKSKTSDTLNRYN